MGETSMIPPSGTESRAEGPIKKLGVVSGSEPVSSGHVSAEIGMFPVRIKSSGAQIVVRVDVEALRRQQEIEEANESIRRRSGG